MMTSNQIVPGMTLSVDDKIYRVLSAVKVTVAKGVPFIKTRLKNITGDEVVERNFKLNQPVAEVTLSEKALEYLYAEGKSYLFLDMATLDQVLIPSAVIGEKIHYLKEGTEVKATFYGETIFSIELPQFLEIMVVKTETGAQNDQAMSGMKIATLETGAAIQVPLFIEAGDVIRIDPEAKLYIQRV
jgi:elongation factor P